MMHTVLNILICLASHISAERLVLNTLSDYPLALCNDGTSATYFYTEDALANPNLLIFLQGGGACKSPEECKKRCDKDKAPLCTAQQRKSIRGTTMWSRDPEENPPFHNFGRVYLHYCSSDVYSGTRNASADTNSYYFYGKHIIEALLEDILKSKPNVENMNQLVLIGTSAGAFGVALNCDFVAEKFHAVNKDLDVRCIADSGDFYPPWVHKEGCDPYELMRQTTEFWQGEGDQSCLESTPEEHLECMIFPSYYNFIETPFMVVAHYIDTTVHGPCTPPLNQDQDFWDNWQQEVYGMTLNYIEVTSSCSWSLI